VITLKKLLIFILILSVFLTGCQSGTAQKLSLELNDFAISPNQFTVKAGSEVTIHVTNNGAVEHDFNIMKYGKDVGDMFDEEDHENVLWEMDLPSGGTQSATFTVPDETGTYQVVCAVPGHLQAGMIGSLEVIK